MEATLHLVSLSVPRWQIDHGLLRGVGGVYVPPHRRGGLLKGLHPLYPQPCGKKPIEREAGPTAQTKRHKFADSHLADVNRRSPSGLSGESDGLLRKAFKPYQSLARAPLANPCHAPGVRPSPAPNPW